MDAIETLMNEHRLIEQTLDALVAFADDVGRRAADERAELARFVTFIREFADTHHHGKEEDILFAAMVQAGFPRQGGPIAVMLYEHDQGRGFIRELAARATQAAPWTADDRQAVVAAAYGYANLLHAHIHKEDAILYPMAEQRLPPEALDAVSTACAAYDREKADAGHQARLVALAEELLARHAPDHAETPRAAPHGVAVHRGCC